MSDFNNLIKNRRIELGLTQLDIAKATGVTEATVSRWESGQISNMRRSKIAALSKVLQLSPSALMDMEPDPVPDTPITTESGPPENIVKLAGRDGSYMEKRVSDEQLALFQSMLDQMKPVDDESI